MKTIDKTVLAEYNAGIEWNRLNTDIGRIEFAYTKELLTSHLPHQQISLLEDPNPRTKMNR